MKRISRELLGRVEKARDLVDPVQGFCKSLCRRVGDNGLRLDDTCDDLHAIEPANRHQPHEHDDKYRRLNAKCWLKHSQGLRTPVGQGDYQG